MPPFQLSQQLLEVVQGAGQSVVGVLRSSAVLQVHPRDPGVREETGKQAMVVKRKVWSGGRGRGGGGRGREGGREEER